MKAHQNTLILASPLLIVGTSFLSAYGFGALIGKWAFVPIILIQWVLFSFFVFRYGGPRTPAKWLATRQGAFGWIIPTLLVGLIPLPIFLLHYELLAPWQIWLPWIILALVNPWLEEFYWRGLLMDAMSQRPEWQRVLYTSAVFSVNHACFGVNSDLNSGPTIIVSTFIMGVVWAVTYSKTKSLRWCIFAHFLVDVFNLSAASFLDLYSGW